MCVVYPINNFMIISHEHKFIFIKTRKTAGSSIEKIFVENYLNLSLDVCTGSDYDNTTRINNLTNNGHVGYQWIKENYPNEWKSYFKFAFARNPWDMLVSYYFWRKNGKPHKMAKGSFDDFLKSKSLDNWNDWKKMYTDDNSNIVLDKLCMYENIHQELLDLPVPYNGEILSTFVKNNTREQNGYRQFYSDETVNLVYDEFKDLINYFNYKF